MSEQIDRRKSELRSLLRAARTGLDPTGERTARLWSYVREEPAVGSARVVMAYEAIAGEPVSDEFVAWCRSLGKTVVIPAADREAPDPVDPSVPDVIVVPGLGFTPDGVRLGRGGGWYDRFLARRRTGCLAIGVCFGEQIRHDLPTEPHDELVDVVVTDTGPLARVSRLRSG